MAGMNKEPTVSAPSNNHPRRRNGLAVQICTLLVVMNYIVNKNLFQRPNAMIDLAAGEY